MNRMLIWLIILLIALLMVFFSACSPVIIYPRDGPEIEESDVLIDFDNNYQNITVVNDNDLWVQVWISERDNKLMGYRQKIFLRVSPNSVVKGVIKGLKPNEEIMIKITIDGFDPVYRLVKLK